MTANPDPSPGLRRLTYAGHSSVRIDLGSTSLLTDPILRDRVAFLRWSGRDVTAGGGNVVAAVLVSHLHPDHCDLPSLRQLGHDQPLVVPAGAARWLRRRGFCDVVALGPGDAHRVGGVDVMATCAEHDGRRRPLGPSGAAVGYVLAGGGARVYFAGDTDLFPGMADLADGLDVALLPVAGWGRTLGPGHLDGNRAARAVEMLAPDVAVPIHWTGLQPFWYRSGTPPGRAAVTTFVQEVGRRRPTTEVVVLTPGDARCW